MNVMACRLCGAPSFRPIRRQSWNGMDLVIVKCLACRLLQVAPMPAPETLRSFYDSEYFRSASPLQGGYEDYSADEPLIARTFLRRLRQAAVAPLHPGVSKALDIGCATGVFLEVLRSAGWQAQGIELSPFAARRTAQKGFHVFEGDWRDAPFPDNSFELISLWDVIEHIPDPLQALHSCRRWLQPGGILLLSTPDASAWLARLLGPYWLGYRSAGEHVYFFGRDTMSELLRQAGFKVVRIRPVGKYIAMDRVITRLSYYTRLFRLLLPFNGFFSSRLSPYLSSGDTMFVVARRL